MELWKSENLIVVFCTEFCSSHTQNKPFSICKWLGLCVNVHFTLKKKMFFNFSPVFGLWNLKGTLCYAYQCFYSEILNEYHPNNLRYIKKCLKALILELLTGPSSASVTPVRWTGIKTLCASLTRRVGLSTVCIMTCMLSTVKVGGMDKVFQSTITLFSGCGILMGCALLLSCKVTACSSGYLTNS